MSTMTSFFNRCLLEGAVVVRSPVEEVLLQGGNPSQVCEHRIQPLIKSIDKVICVIISNRFRTHLEG